MNFDSFFCKILMKHCFYLPRFLMPHFSDQSPTAGCLSNFLTMNSARALPQLPGSVVTKLDTHPAAGRWSEKWGINKRGKEKQCFIKIL